jgi:hypothetical protein
VEYNGDDDDGVGDEDDEDAEDVDDDEKAPMSGKAASKKSDWRFQPLSIPCYLKLS